MGACCCPQTLIRDMAVQLPTSPSSNRYIHKDYLSEGGHGKVYKVYDDYAKCFVSCKETSQSKKIELNAKQIFLNNLIHLYYQHL